MRCCKGLMGTGALMAAATWAAAGAALAGTPDTSLWSGSRALADIGTQVSFGVRSPGTTGHARTIDLIVAEMTRAGATVTRQAWTYHPKTGPDVPLTNIIARFDGQNPRRVLVGTHYDSLVRAYADTRKPNDPMPGANNSASGVAVLLETAHAIATSAAKPAVGTDFVFFDGEEGPLALGAGDPDWFPLGSPYFAAHLADTYPAAKPLWSAEFDMVCYRDTVFHPETYSLATAQEQVRRFWSLGEEVAPKKFDVDAPAVPIGDDQLALTRVGIPSILVIGFEYDPWFNTTQDTPDKCSVETVEAVGKTLLRHIYAP